MIINEVEENIESTIESKIINNPKNYAAIYARISGSTDNNSISMQIQLATEALRNKSLLVYNTYVDYDSAKKHSPTERKALSKLLLDAKAGCFSTVIIYRLDRLVRRYKDWLEIKNTFSRLGITLIYSDNSQAIPSNSAHGNFFEGLMVMVAEMEPDTIRQRASNGRKIRRKQGSYSCGIITPFGYICEKSTDLDSSRISKSRFLNDDIKILFVKYIFSEFYTLINKEKSSTDYKTNIHYVYNKLDSIIKVILSCIDNKTSPIFEVNSDDNDITLYHDVINSLSNNSNETVIEKILDVKYHYIVKYANSLETKRSISNLRNTLYNPIYSGYMLADSNHKFKGLKAIPAGAESQYPFTEELDIKAFVKIINLEGCITYDVFASVYSYMAYEDLINKDTTPNFILKNALKCTCGKKLKLCDSYTLTCGNKKCPNFLKFDLLKFIIKQIIADCLATKSSSIKKLSTTLEQKTKIDTLNIINAKNKKFNAVKEYINSNDSDYVNYIYSHKNSIDNYTNINSKYREKITLINTLLSEIDNQKDLSSSILEESLVEKIADYIFNHEDAFIPIFSEIIKEAKVILKNDIGKIKISYEFAP